MDNQVRISISGRNCSSCLVKWSMDISFFETHHDQFQTTIGATTASENPIAVDVGNMVKCLSEVVTDLCCLEPLRRCFAMASNAPSSNERKTAWLCRYFCGKLFGELL